jgi:hypothetical protein
MISACIGLTLSIALVLLVYVGHVEFSIRLSSFYIEGRLLSVVAVFVGPFVGAAIGFLGSLMTHQLFELILAWFSGFPFTGTWQDPQDHDTMG